MTQCIVIGFLLASLLDQKIKSEAVFRTIFIFPFAVSGIVTGVVWRWLMYPSAGLNQLFESFGLGFLKSKWYTDPTWGVLAVSIAASWQFSGYVMALYLAGLRGISHELHEAAAIDGANTWQLYRRIIIPLLAPVTFTAIVLTGMGSIRVFDIPQVLGSGAAFSTDFLSFLHVPAHVPIEPDRAGRSDCRCDDHPGGVPGGAVPGQHAVGGIADDAATKVIARRDLRRPRLLSPPGT